jgi:hypothetical protein
MGASNCYTISENVPHDNRPAERAAKFGDVNEYHSHVLLV